MISTSWDFSFRADGFETKTQKYSHKISSRIISGEQVHKIVDVSTQNRWMLQDNKNNFQLPGVPVETLHFWWWKANVHVIDLHIGTHVLMLPTFPGTSLLIVESRLAIACPYFDSEPAKLGWYAHDSAGNVSNSICPSSIHPATSFHILPHLRRCGI